MLKSTTGWDIHSLKRKFDGRIFYYHDSYRHKKEVEKKAKRFRLKGYYARIVKRGKVYDYGYDLFIRNKQ